MGWAVAAEPPAGWDGGRISLFAHKVTLRVDSAPSPRVSFGDSHLPMMRKQLRLVGEQGGPKMKEQGESMAAWAPLQANATEGLRLRAWGCRGRRWGRGPGEVGAVARGAGAARRAASDSFQPRPSRETATTQGCASLPVFGGGHKGRALWLPGAAPWTTWPQKAPARQPGAPAAVHPAAKKTDTCHLSV